ncbi:RNA methyltransferase [Pelagibaculum spongiae]|uniref:23S rRNA methyltransferase n=1 Tax=Pelagibaculum spongiae TaxID=2080658 RepID=A0A2V1H083_9GAMM|nr:RNA methyltransferase [Pelagibaculum spongiae]PVZ68403.1 23S rRNA methyltransferase [Pelagibaculum spongiae]
MSKSVVIGLTDPKSPSNVGSILRAAGCYQAQSICYTGTRYTKAAKYHTDTKQMSQKIPVTAVDSLLDAVPEGAKIVCIELVEGAVALPEFEHPENAFYVFGPEDGSLEQAVVDRADAVVYIPTIGCMNLAATVNVLLYDRMAKSYQQQANNPLDQGDQLIRQSRDTNNLLSIK